MAVGDLAFYYTLYLWIKLKFEIQIAEVIESIFKYHFEKSDLAPLIIYLFFIFILLCHLKIMILQKQSSCSHYVYSPAPGLSNLRPTGHMRPNRQLCAAHEVMYFL